MIHLSKFEKPLNSFKMNLEKKMLTNKGTVRSRNEFPSLTPNDEQQLVEVLTKSLTGVNEDQKIAENTLHTVEKRNGYLSLLLVRFIITNI